MTLSRSSVSQSRQFATANQNRPIPNDQRHLIRFAQATIRLINHWRSVLTDNEYNLVEYLLANTYGRGPDNEWTQTPPDRLMDRRRRSEAAHRLLNEFYLVERAGRLWRVNLDVLFENGLVLMRCPPGRTNHDETVRQAGHPMSAIPDKSPAHLLLSLEDLSSNTLMAVLCPKCDGFGLIGDPCSPASPTCDCEKGREAVHNRQRTFERKKL